MLGSVMKTETIETLGCMYSCIKKTNMLVPTCEYISIHVIIYAVLWNTHRLLIEK